MQSREPTPIERRAREIEQRFPNALPLPVWWVILRPVLKVACLTAILAPTAAATSGLTLTPVWQFAMLLIVGAAGYALSEMSPGFRPKGDERG